MRTISVIPNKEKNVEPLSKILLPAVYIVLINVYIIKGAKKSGIILIFC